MRLILVCISAMGSMSVSISSICHCISCISATAFFSSMGSSSGLGAGAVDDDAADSEAGAEAGAVDDDAAGVEAGADAGAVDDDAVDDDGWSWGGRGRRRLG